jgi:uncharacterized membrane-anchored protein
MFDFVNVVITNPYAIFVSTMSALAAFGVILFFWGFFGYILAHGDTEHQTHAREQIVQGFSFILTIAVVWEVLRWIASLFI